MSIRQSSGIFSKKIKNPLRKQALIDAGENIDNRNQVSLDAAQWKDYILRGSRLNAEDKKIRTDYLQLKEKFPKRAETWLNQLALKYSTLTALKLKIPPHNIKIYEKQGIQVFKDEFVSRKFDSVGTYDHRIMVHAINAMLLDIHDILPNRKPRIIITSNKQNPFFKNLRVKDSPAIYIDRLIYIDQYAVECPNFLVHEYAHFIVDLIPKQTEPLLDKAYKDMLDLYWKRAKVKRQSVTPETNSRKELARTEAIRTKISKKLGFPEYGLMDRDEFFAVLIENWKTFPNNAATYRYKQLVKQVLQRL